MKKIVRNLLIMAMLFCSFIGISQAENQQWVPAKSIVANLDKTINEVKSKTSLPVLFPQQLPKLSAGKQYYLSSMINDDGSHYAITVDLTPDCNGAKYCTIGLIAADKNQQPQIHAAINGPDLTESVMLTSTLRGYYTPAHAEADFWPAMIEWRVKDVLYKISWKTNNNNDKNLLIKLAKETK